MHFRRFASLCLLGISLVSTPVFSQKKLSDQYTSLYEQLIKPEVDASKTATVSNFVLKRDVGEFTFINGQIQLLKPVNGRVIGAVFTGEGRFSFAPPTEVERKQLERFKNVEKLDEPFMSVVLYFGDETAEELQKTLAFKAGEPNAKGIDAVKEALKYLHDDEHKYFGPEFIKAFSGTEKNELFYAHMEQKGEDPMMFGIDPYEVEEVQFFVKSNNLHRKTREMVNMFHWQKDYVNGVASSDESKDDFAITHNSMDVTIAEDMKMRTSSKMDITVLKDSLKELSFSLYHKLKADSIVLKDGTRADFRNSNGSIYVAVPPFKKGETTTITMYYSGQAVQRIYDWIVLETSIGWYPRHNYTAKSTYDFTFHTPDIYKFFSVGDKISEEISNGVYTSRWKLDVPQRNMSFNLGYFKEYNHTDDRVPPITVQATKNQSGFTVGNSASNDVAQDIANSIVFYEHVFGKTNQKHFTASEIPLPHGEAFPGFIHLAWSTFDRSELDVSGFEEYFRAHEVAHQWWPIGAGFKTYHDQWMSEGFASFSGLWYMQTVLKDNDKFFNMLEKYKEHLLNRPKAAPLWLGYRTNSRFVENGYNTIVYEKGAWVLQMLRNLLLDMNTMNEDRFAKVMRDYYGAYNGKLASTEDFKKSVEKSVGQNMDWFFNQWVYGTEIPKYTFAYKAEQQPDGKYKVRCRIKTEGVSDNFQMFVPITIDFGKDRKARMRIPVKGKLAELDLPPLPLEPEDIIFNDFQSVLATVKTESW
jgi:hypothetical protein